MMKSNNGTVYIAFTYGTRHGGFAPGLDRLLMVLLKEA
jgi:aspartyl-tRNA synthetase